jgi:hypothetical protein
MDDIGSCLKRRMSTGSNETILGFNKGTLYREQWYPIWIDRAYKSVATDDLGCTLFGRMNKVKVLKMRWLGTASIDKEYRKMVVYLVLQPWYRPLAPGGARDRFLYLRAFGSLLLFFLL